MNAVNYLSNLIKTLDKFANNIVDKVAKEVQKRAKSSTLFKGTALRNAINIIDNGTFSKIVIAEKDYAGYVEFGNNQKGPYIYPVRAKALHFRINGQDIFAKRVRSHGPLPFMKNATIDTNKVAKGIMEKELRNWIK